jgi:hypothetical protein
VQIFPTDGWDRLIEGLLNTTESGGPTHHLDEYEVMENKGLAVHGGWKVTSDHDSVGASNNLAAAASCPFVHM